jgi:hypothetical protein
MYTPAPQRIFELYQKIDNGETLELAWKNPGRRPPTPDKVVPTAPVPHAIPEPGANDFDFEDESQGVMTPQRRAPGSELKGSARKQTASFDSVLSNMKRHKIMDDQGQEPKDAQKKS